MSWNASGLNYSAVMLAGLKHTIREHSPTVILLQEVHPEQQVALRSGFASTYVFAAGDNHATHSLLIGVRSPANLYNAVFSPFVTSTASRGILSALMQCSGKSIQLMTTHLESGPDASPIRREQFAELLQSDAHLIAGDFNIREAEIDRHTFDQHWRDAWVVRGQDETRRYTWDAHKNSRIPASFERKPRFRFDRCFIRKDDAFEILDFSLIMSKFKETHPSDHFALIVSLRLR